MSSRSHLADAYMEAFRSGDRHAAIACLTEDVVWRIHGAPTRHGIAEFAAEMDNAAFDGRPLLTVDRTCEGHDAVVLGGRGEGRLAAGGTFVFAFSTWLTFRGDLIAEVDSYIVPLTQG